MQIINQRSIMMQVQPSFVNHTSSVNHLKTIWTFEKSESFDTPTGPFICKTASVFFEFIESNHREEAHDYMDSVCYQASKMNLQPDRRIPKEAKKGFCWGFQASGSVEELIRKVESAMTWGNSPQYEVPLTPIEASMLEYNQRKMPAKDYSDVFCCNYENQWS
jgi:hypothetical protein